MEILAVFFAITILFIVLLAMKKVTTYRFCVLCVSVSLSWVGLLLLLQLGFFENVALVALLMGQSVVGLYYFAEKRLPQQYMVFRLAGLLTLTYAAYAILIGFNLLPLFLLVPVWSISGLLYAYRNTPRVKSTVEHILACCRDW